MAETTPLDALQIAHRFGRQEALTEGNVQDVIRLEGRVQKLQESVDQVLLEVRRAVGRSMLFAAAIAIVCSVFVAVSTVIMVVQWLLASGVLLRAPLP